MFRTIQIAAALLLIGCAGASHPFASHQFQIRFNEIHGLVKSDPVFFDRSAIGKVTEIEYTEKGDYLVRVSVEDQFAALPKDTSTYFIDESPQSKNRKAVRIIQTGEGGKPLAKNAVVEGKSRYTAAYDRIIDDVFEKFREMNIDLMGILNRLESFAESGQISRQIEQLEKQLDQLLGQLGHLSEEMQQKLEEEILPRIREQIEELRRRLEKLGREDELTYVDQKMKTLSEKIKT